MEQERRERRERRGGMKISVSNQPRSRSTVQSFVLIDGTSKVFSRNHMSTSSWERNYTTSHVFLEKVTSKEEMEIL